MLGMALAACGGVSDDSAVGTTPRTTFTSQEDAGSPRGPAQSDDEVSSADDDAGATDTQDSDEPTDDAPADTVDDTLASGDEPDGGRVADEVSDDEPAVDDSTANDEVADDVPVADDDPVVDDEVASTDDEPPADVTPLPGRNVCERSDLSTSDGFCLLDESCSGNPSSKGCNDQGNGSWLCTCINPLGRRDFELTGVDENDACYEVGEICDRGLEVEFAGEPMCSEPILRVTDYQCTQSEDCSVVAPVADGVSAVRFSGRAVTCTYTDSVDELQSSDELTCQCSSPDAYKLYQLNGVPLSTACLDFQPCSDNPAVDLPEPTCTIISNESAASSCEIQKECIQSAEPAEGAVVELTELEVANCSFSDGEATCSCRGGARLLQLRMALASESTACEEALAVCTSPDAISPEGELRCEVSSQLSDEGGCGAAITCGRDAIVNGATVSILDEMEVACIPDGDNFVCNCASNVDSASLRVEATTNSDACTVAAEQCPELISIDIQAR